MKPSLLLARLGLTLLTLTTLASASPPEWTVPDSVESVARLLADRYAVEEVGQRYAERLRSKLAAGHYAALTNGEALASRLTADLQAVHGDRHLRVRFSPDRLPADEAATEPTPEESRRFHAGTRRENCGFVKVEVLPGNVGLLEFNYFGLPDIGAPKVHAAMQFLADTDALIIDLRRNGGATHVELMSLLTRYLVEEKDIVNTEIRWRGKVPRHISQAATLPLVAPRYLGKPVFILTSSRTFSGAEAFAYELQAIKRARIFGSRSGGGANPGGEFRANDHFAAWVPLAVSVHPITGTNWEGTGVAPDVAVKAAQALPVAHAAALETLLARDAQDPDWKRVLKHELKRVAAQSTPARPTVPTPFELHGFPDAAEVCVVGPFNEWAPREAAMKRVGDRWQARLDLEPGSHEYKFWVDGQWIIDPRNSATRTTNDGHTNSLVTVTAPR